MRPLDGDAPRRAEHAQDVHPKNSACFYEKKKDGFPLAPTLMWFEVKGSSSMSIAFKGSIFLGLTPSLPFPKSSSSFSFLSFFQFPPVPCHES